MKSWTTEAIVLKRVSVGEADRVITLLTPDEGKLVCIAKGVRKMNSSQRAYLEPGNHISLHLRGTHTLPIISQTQLLNQFALAKEKLQRVKQVFEVLELVDVLFVENMEDPQGFVMIREILEILDTEKSNFQAIQNRLRQLFTYLGYQDLHETQYKSILEYASAVAERPVRSYDFLSVRHKGVVK